MMNKFLLEIGTEEIPSAFIDQILENLKMNADGLLKELRIGFDRLSVFGTPRRLILLVEGIYEKQQDIFHKVKGPSATVAFDEEGGLQKAASKFAEANQVKPGELIIEKTNKGDYVFALKKIKGKKTESLLSEICLNLITNTGLNLPKSMRWGNSSLRFIRPVRWILALYNTKIVSFKIDSLTSGRITYGHRLLSPGFIKIDNVDNYFSAMEKHLVVIDAELRKEMIKKQIIEKIKEIKGQEYIEQALLEEVKNLTEYPKALLGSFDEIYLDLPVEVLTAVMIKHQKYFPVYKKNNSLLPFFIVVINGNEEQYTKSIVYGNERVLKARLEDAKFFYQEDQKSTGSGLKPLDNNVEKLNSVIFQEGLGTIYDKVSRLIALSQRLGATLGLNHKTLKILKRAAQLCKSDLITEMVKEFPELQGIMGREYALLQGEDSQVALSISEHYLPRFSEDSFPTTMTGSILSISDKLDNIVSCFINGMVPDGSQDPYALRRQALGIINIVLFNKLNFSLNKMIDSNINLLASIGETKEKICLTDSVNKQAIKDFIFQRFRHFLLEKKFKYDLIDAVFAKSSDNILDALARVEVLQKIYGNKNFANTITAATRAFNLSKNIAESKIDFTLLQEKEEIQLYHNFIKLKENLEKLLSEQRYSDIFTNLELMNKPIDLFFDRVLVMVEDEKIRKNRLALLKSIADLYFSVADLNKIALAKVNIGR